MVKSNEVVRKIDIFDINHFEELVESSTLGKGAFGIVYKTKSKTGDKSTIPVAIKFFWDDISEKNVTKIVDLYGRLDHENFVFLKGVLDTTLSPFALVSEYLPRGNLLKFVKENYDLFSKKRVGEICEGICNGMEYLHGNGIVHEALCAENILLDKEYKAKISDYCLSHFVRPHEQNFGEHYDKLKGPYGVRVRWQPMECIVLEDGRSPEFSYASDVWSFGVIVFEIWSKGKLPYSEAKTNTEAAELILSGKNPFDFFKPQMNKDLYKMVEQALSKNPEDRPLFSSLKKWVEIGHAPDTRPTSKRRSSGRKADDRRMETRSESSRSSQSRQGERSKEVAKEEPKELKDLQLTKEVKETQEHRDRSTRPNRTSENDVKKEEKWREEPKKRQNTTVRKTTSCLSEMRNDVRTDRNERKDRSERSERGDRKERSDQSNGDHCCSVSKDTERRMRALEERVAALEIALENKSNAAKE